MNLLLFFFINLHWKFPFQDTEILKAKQSNVRDYQVLTNWNHADFDYGKNSRSVLYSSILESFNNEGMPVTNVSSSMYNE